MNATSRQDQGRQEHWQQTYRARSERDVSWHQDIPEPSLSLVRAAAGSPTSRIIDIGGGTSRLVDHLVRGGFTDVTLLDVSSSALEQSWQRLGPKAAAVHWITADITTWEPSRQYDVWHDRATFHFMVTEADRSGYLARLRKALAPEGLAIIATFAPDGPETCSGLPVTRYDAAGLADTLGRDFQLVRTERHHHQTPWGSVQSFQFGVFQRAKT